MSAARKFQNGGQGWFLVNCLSYGSSSMLQDLVDLALESLNRPPQVARALSQQVCSPQLLAQSYTAVRQLLRCCHGLFCGALHAGGMILVSMLHTHSPWGSHCQPAHL